MKVFFPSWNLFSSCLATVQTIPGDSCFWALNNISGSQLLSSAAETDETVPASASQARPGRVGAVFARALWDGGTFRLKDCEGSLKSLSPTVGHTQIWSRNSTTLRKVLCFYHLKVKHAKTDSEKPGKVTSGGFSSLPGLSSETRRSLLGDLSRLSDVPALPTSSGRCDGTREEEGPEGVTGPSLCFPASFYF